VRNTDLEAYAHQDLPFDHVVEAVNPPRAAHRHPLFQTMLVLQGAAQRSLSLPGVEAVVVRPSDVELGVPAKYDLAFSLTELATLEGPGGVHVFAEYRPDVRDAATVQELLAGWLALLVALCDDPDQGIDGPALPIVDVPAPPAADGEGDRGDPGRTAQGPSAGGLLRTVSADRSRSAPHEAVLTGLFADLLERPGAGADDDFFACGGHSLLAARLISRIRTTLEVDIELRTLFDHPTPAGLARHLYATPPRPLLTAGPRPDRPGLSAGQERLEYVNRLSPDPLLNVALAYDVVGPVDVAALEAALADTIARHEPLRTVYRRDEHGCHPFLLPVAAAAPAITGAPLTGEPGPDLDAVLTRDAGRPFDLTVDPPLRARLHRTGADRHVLSIVVHHIAFDGWSLAPFARDLGRAYAARVHGRAPAHPPPAVTYTDFVRWQRAVLGAADDGSSVAGRAVAFWRDALAGMPPEIVLPADGGRAAADDRGDYVELDLDPALHGALTGLAQAHGATLFMVVRAALAVLLTRLGAGTDIPLGTAVAGRDNDQLEELVGFFVNTVVLRTDTSGNPSFAELLGRVRESDLATYAHRDLPFDQLVKALNPPRAEGRHPLFQVMIGMQNMAGGDLQLDGLAVHERPGVVGPVAAKYDLEFIVRPRQGPDRTPGGVSLLLVYAVSRFDRSTATSLLTRLRHLLRVVTADPVSGIDEIDVLTAAERREVLTLGEGPRRDAPTATLGSLVVDQASRTPDRTAVVHDGEQLTYAELATRSRRLARRLRAVGVGPEDIVAVTVTPGIATVVALLGVLRAGAAYLPIDPQAPARRTAYVLRDARVSAVVAPVAEASALPGVDVPVVAPDESDGEVADAAASDVPVDPAQAAYVIYTSGSTGKPKGVVVEHRSVVDYLSHTASAYLGARGTALLPTPITFDLSVTALYTPLVTGGCVLLDPLDAEATGSDRKPFAFLKVTPSHLAMMAAMPNAPAPTADLLLGGEAVEAPVLRRWMSEHPDVSVLNVYGPTEATVNCTEYRVPATGPGDVVPIGRPQPNARVYVLDARLDLAPQGVVGELYLAGDGLARGYLGRPGLTAERFVPDPFGPAGSRMYRSGDRARWTVDGQLEFRGRADDQLSVRGHRVEPGEVEAALCEHPDLERAVVVMREAGPGDARLIGYVVARPGAPTPDPAKVAATVSRTLPPYMVPDVVVLERLPLSAHGKVDRSRLPAPTVGGDAGASGAPRTPLERRLVQLWSDVLRVAEVGVDDDFFGRGGHSLLAAQLAIRLRRTFGDVVSLRTLLAAPTVSAVAAAIEGTASSGHPSVRSVDPRARVDGILPPVLPPAAPPRPGRVLLTGATGFVGTHLLAALAARPDTEVVAVVRAAGAAEGRSRIQRSLARLGLPDVPCAVVPGDLGQPRLGLSAQAFAELATSVDAVLHNGAHVDALASYATLAPANVEGTLELLRLACLDRLLPFRFVSTVSVVRPGARGTGYAATKRDAESLVVAAAERGLPSAVYRLPRVVAGLGSGYGNERDAVLRLLRDSVALGAAPDLDLEEHWLPADVVARRLVATLDERPADVVHVLTAERSVRFADVVALAGRTGSVAETVPLPRWLALLEAHDPDERALVAGLLGEGGPTGQAEDVPAPAPVAVPIVLPGPSDTDLLRSLDELAARNGEREERHEHG
jgi:amino acid adenylation domain-containing protein/thioester reductase-like protein